MTSFKRYFIYHFNTTVIRLGVLLVIASIITSQINAFGFDYMCIAEITGWACFIIPILELHSFKSRRNMDTVLSLPISRKKIALAHFLNGYVHLFIVVTVSTLIAVIPLTNPIAEYSVGQLLLTYISILPMALLTYGIYMFVFMQANTVIDGVITQVLSVFAICLPLVSLGETFNFGEHIEKVFSYQSFVLYNPVDCIVKKIFGYSYLTTVGALVQCLVIGALGVVAIWGYFKSFEKLRAEKIGGISDAIIGYKILIPIYAFSLSLAGVYVFILLAAFIGYVIYRRGVHFKQSDIICLLITLVLQLIGEAI